MDKISVIIPVYNSEIHLRRCIDSILNQTYKNLELILVDDGSTDDSEQICETYAGADSRVLYFNAKNHPGGVSAARNLGVKKATGTYLTFVDSDDWIEPDAYAHMIQKIEQHHADFCLCGYLRENQKEKKITNVKNVEEEQVRGRDYFLDRIYLKFDIVFNLWNMVVKREKVSTLMMAEDIYLSEDNLYVLKLLMQTEKGVLSPKCFYHYVQYDNSLSHQRKFSKKTFSQAMAVERQAQILKEYDKNIWRQYRHMLLKTYMDIVCKIVMYEKCEEETVYRRKIKKKIFKELFTGGLFAKNSNKTLIVHSFLVMINFSCFSGIYRSRHKDEIA